jgi:hypothetical protein
VGKRLLGEREPEDRIGSVRLVEHVEDAGVVGWVDDDQHVLEVLGGCPHHARPTDIDVLDQAVEGRARIRRRLCERVQVDDDEVDRANALRRDSGQVVRPVAAREDPTVHRGVQGLDTPVHHLRESGQIRNGGDRESGRRQHARGSTR